MAARPTPSRRPTRGPAHPPGPGEADAALLIARVGRELDGLALAVLDLQRALGPSLESAAARDPALMVEMQTLDIVAQSLEGLSSFLAAAGRRSVGLEPLAFEDLTAALTLRGMADRLMGRTVDDAEADFELF